MDKELFIKYVKKIKEIISGRDASFSFSTDELTTALGEEEITGYSKAIVDLLPGAFKLYLDFKPNYPKGYPSIDELATWRYYKDNEHNYKLNAFFFVYNILYVALGIININDVDVESFDDNEFRDFDPEITVSSITDPVEKELKKYAIKLLDLSRSNQLVNYRSIRTATLPIYVQNINLLMTYLSANKKIYLKSWKSINANVIYKCQKCGDILVKPYDYTSKKLQPNLECPQCDSDSKHGRKSFAPIKESLIPIRYNIYSCPNCHMNIVYDDLARNRFKCPHCQALVPSYPIVFDEELNKLSPTEFVALTGDNTSKETCKTLETKSGNLMRHFGLHVLYLAVGFLRWKDKMGTLYNSPILLVPINMTLDKTKGTYYFEIESGAKGFEVNKILVNMLKAYNSTVAFELPPLNRNHPENYFVSLENYFKSLDESLLPIVKDWKIMPEAGLGLFHYQKLQLENDITENKEIYLKHPIIRRFCKDFDAEIPLGKSSSKDFTLYQLLDADSSQEEVIQASLDGKSFVLQGPPGSGKSQTITNMIAANIAVGKNVLFVTEKGSARSIITDNFKKVHLGDRGEDLNKFVLDIEHISSRKGAIGRKPLVDSLNASLNEVYKSTRPSDYVLINDNITLKKKVSTYMEEIKEEHDGLSYINLLQNAVEFIDYKTLDLTINFTTSREELLKLEEFGNKYLSLVESEVVRGDTNRYDYRLDPLFKFKYQGEEPELLFQLSKDYYQTFDILSDCSNFVTGLGFPSVSTFKELEKYCSLFDLLATLPIMCDSLAKQASSLDYGETEEFLKERQHDFHNVYLNQHNIDNKDKFTSLDSKGFGYKAYLLTCSGFGLIKRLGKQYKEAKEFFISICEPSELNKYNLNKHKELLRLADDYIGYYSYNDSLQRLNEEKRINFEVSLFGRQLGEYDEYTDGIKLIKDVRDILSMPLLKTIKDKDKLDDMILRINEESSNLRGDLIYFANLIRENIVKEKNLKQRLSSLVVGSELNKWHENKVKMMSDIIIENGDRLENYHLFVELLKERLPIDRNKYLDELINKGIKTSEELNGVLNKAFYIDILKKYINTYPFKYIHTFDKKQHEALIDNYAKNDVKMLSTGGMRLYELLSKNLAIKGTSLSGSSTKLKQIPNKTGYAFRDTIKENFEYIRYIKPCFMMSPLNVSQYIDISLKFDLVIFDEASQIFTEDALASIVRGNQVIIAGDSKQLPPCDFFKAGDITQDDEETYIEEENKISNSLLDAADTILGTDLSKQLLWHYRSSDECLIDFANKHMEYNLITFPSAYKDPNNGIRYHQIPYHPSTCYDAGKSGSHTNKGEARKILDIIYEEMNNPERNHFSIGVVAFSNAQALLIEEMWNEYKNLPDKKPLIDEWERNHQKEEIVFCNLDTMQGDERDTMIISTCYSKDKNEKFYLSYLGRIRLESGKKRINVAITRSRHQMIVVTTLDQATLDNALSNTIAPEEHKEGAIMLKEFLKYAEAYAASNDLPSTPTSNEFVKSVCDVLDEYGIKYQTEIGASKCKINIGIFDKYDDKKYALGIIIDDPRREDFDSPREYARLTGQVLSKKYGWKLYRIYPISWFYNYKNEKIKLLEVIGKTLDRA